MIVFQKVMGLDLVGEHLPNCPPSEARPAEGRYFRFMRNGHLIADNFKSHVELGKVAATCCKGHALSLVPGTLAAVKQRVAEQPFFRKYGLATLSLSFTHGKLHHDQECHASWWRPKDLSPTRIVDEQLALLYAPTVTAILETK